MNVLAAIHRDADVVELLRSLFEFDIFRRDQHHAASVASGRPLESIAGDFAGSSYFLCGSADSERSVVYATSEGQAGLIGESLAEALEIIIGLASWQDCLKFSAGGDLEVMKVTARHLERDLRNRSPGIAADRLWVAEALSLQVVDADTLLARLLAAVTRTMPDYEFSDDTGTYEGLLGTSRPESNPFWR